MERPRPKLTSTQKEVLELMWESRVKGKRTQRYTGTDGQYALTSREDLMRPIAFAEEEGEFALKLHEKKSDAPLSPYFINLRGLPPTLLTKAAEAIAETIEGLKVDFCTGIPKAGIPLAEKVAEVTGIPMRYIFGKEEGTGTRKIVAAPGAPKGNGARMLYIDDLITGSDTKKEAHEAGSELGYMTAGIAVLIDREQGGREELRKLFGEQGLTADVHAPILVSKAFEHYYTTSTPQRESITRERYLDCMNYLNDARETARLERLGLVAA